MSDTKLSKQQFLNKYPPLVAQNLDKGEIANRLGISRGTLYNYLDRWGGSTEVQQEVQEVKESQEMIALENGNASAQRSIEIAFDRITRTIQTLDKWREELESKDWNDSYFVGVDEEGEEVHNFNSEFDKDKYVLGQVQRTTQEAKSLLDVAKTIFKKDQVVKALEVNIDNREQSIEYGLEWDEIRELLRYVFDQTEVDTDKAIGLGIEWMEDVKEVEEVEVGKGE